MKQIIEIEADVPDGFKAIALRAPRKGEYFCVSNNIKNVEKARSDFGSDYIRLILEPLPPTSADFGKRVRDDAGTVGRLVLVGQNQFVIERDDKSLVLTDHCWIV